MKCRLHEPSLAQPGLAVVGRQAIADQQPQPFGILTLDIVVLIIEKYMLDSLGMCYQQAIWSPQLGNPTILTRSSQKELVRAFAHIWQHTKYRVRAWAWSYVCVTG